LAVSESDGDRLRRVPYSAERPTANANDRRWIRFATILKAAGQNTSIVIFIAVAESGKTGVAGG
jgi:hypothetical protein